MCSFTGLGNYGISDNYKRSFINDSGQIVAIGSQTIGSENISGAFILTPFPWATAAGGTWGNINNWNQQLQAYPGSVGDTATFGNLYDISGNLIHNATPNVTLDGDRTLSAISFNNSANGIYTISSGTLYPSSKLIMDNTDGSRVMFIVAGGNHSIAAPVELHSDLSVKVLSGCQLNISGQISEYGGSKEINKIEEGIFVLSATNSYTGPTIIDDGTLMLNMNGQIATSDYISVSSDGIFKVNGGSHIVGNINNDGIIEIINNGSLTAGNIEGIGETTVTSVALTANRIFQNKLTVGPGSTVTIAPLSGNDSLQVATALTVNGTLGLGGNSQTISSAIILNGTVQNGTIINSGANNFDGRSGTVSSNLQGAVGLTKTTTGILTLSGTNSYSGGTVINGGALRFNSASSLPSTPSTRGITINGNGALVAAGPYTTVMGWLASQKIAQRRNRCDSFDFIRR